MQHYKQPRCVTVQKLDWNSYGILALNFTNQLVQKKG